MGFYASGRELRGFETGIQYALARVLVDPQFIFRFEREPASLRGAARSTGSAISSWPRACRFSSGAAFRTMSCCEWPAPAGSPIPPCSSSRRGGCSPIRVPDALVDNVAGQWLLLRQLETVSPGDEGVRRQPPIRRSSARRSCSSRPFVREDRSVLDLIDADYTFVDERLARHYGIPNIRGSRFRRVTLDDEARRGLLGHGSLLTVTSAGNRTSPVKRGKWILENLLGAPVPLPPPGVETNLERRRPPGGAITSLRQRLEQHRANPSCASCHAVMDPIGFSLENFDLIGTWRDADGGTPVNASGRLVDGTRARRPGEPPAGAARPSRSVRRDRPPKSC